MSLLRFVAYWVRNCFNLAFRRHRMERELEDELASYAHLLALRKAGDGASPRAVLLDRRHEMGPWEPIKEGVREERMGISIVWFWRDLRLATKRLLRHPGFACVAIATTALAIGGGTAIFSVIQRILLDPLPYHQPDRLMWVWSDLDKSGYVRAPLSGPEILDLRRQSRLFEDFAAIQSLSMQMTGGEAPVQLQGGIVTANFFQVLGVDPILGRLFRPLEGGSRSNSILLSAETWKNQFGSDPQIVGKSIQLDDRSFNVVGVLPPGLRLLFPAEANIEPRMNFWIPRPESLSQLGRGLYFLRTFGRLRPGVSWKQAREEIERLNDTLVPGHAEYTASGRSFYVVPLQADSTRQLRSPLLVAGVGISLLILISCANVAHLIVGRTLSRQPEFALQSALGASRGRLIRQLLTEGALLGLLGGLLGIGLSFLGIRLFLWLEPASLAQFETFEVSWEALGLSLGLTLLTTLIFSLIPLLDLSRLDLNAFLKGSRGVTRGRQLRGPLILLETALVVVLLVTSGLMARTLFNLGRLDPGYQPASSLTFKLSLPRRQYSGIKQTTALTANLRERLTHLPGVSAAGVISVLPLDNLPNWSSSYQFREILTEERGSREADVRAVGPGAFEALGVTLLEGRFFREADDLDAERVVIVDELLAARSWPGESALDKLINVDFLVGGDFEATWARIVGVVSHLRHRDLTTPIREQIFIPFRQSPRNPLAFALLAPSGSDEALVASIREQVAAVDPKIAPYDFRRLSEYVESATSSRRFTGILASAFALNALLLAALGIYGVVNYAVSQRRKEVGIRVSLGAGPFQIQSLLAREAFSWATLGLALGLLLSGISRSLLENLLFEVSALDPLTYLLAGLTLLGLSLLACWLPARRALAVSPSEVLRTS